LRLPSSLLLTAGILILLAEPAWLFIHGQLSAAILRGSQPFHFNNLVGFALFNALLGLILLSTLRFRWLQLRWRTVTWLVWVSLIVSCAMTARQAGEVDGFAELLICLLLISGMLCECSPLWLASLSVISMTAFVWLAVNRGATAIEWFTVLVGVVVAHSGQEMTIRKRNEAAAARTELETRMAQLNAAERRASQSEESLKRIIEYAPDVITVNSHSDGRFIMVNREFEKCFGRREVIGRTPVDHNLILPRATMDEVMRQLGQDGVSRDAEFEYRKHDGTLEYYLASCILAEMNGERSVITFARDITGIKQMQRQLRQSETILRKIFEASPDCITLARLADGRFQAVNDGFVRQFGFSREEAVGRTQQELRLWADPLQAMEVARRLRKDGLITNMQLRLRHKNGAMLPCLFSAAVTEIGSELCVVAIVHDITDLKRTEADLVQAREGALAASRAKSEFLSTMSHEIRTPMNAVLGMADLLADTELSSEQRYYLEIMIANGNALLDLINSILDLARIEAGRMQVEKSAFDLTDLVEQTISTFAVRAHAKGLELAARIEPGVPDRLTGDPLRLRQVLINLLGNAVKFTEVGQVTLEVAKAPRSEQAGHLKFTVADTGIGIPSDKIAQVFSSFAQVDSSTTRKYGGSGLGLAIAKRLTELMGGQITVDSEPGKGSKFSFTLQFGLAPRILSVASSVPIDLAGYRVLVVDDNHINRLIIREMMAGCGAEIVEADSGEHAVELVMKAGHHPYEIILLDNRMPGIDGVEVVQRIRTAHLPVEPIIVMLSSDDVKPQLVRLKELALDVYLVKPITRKELFEAIRRLLENAGRLAAEAMRQRQAHTIERSANSAMRILIAEDAPDNRRLIQAYLRDLPLTLDVAENGRVAVEKFINTPYDLVFMDIQMPELDGLDATRMIREWEQKHGMSPSLIVALTASVLDEDVKRVLAAGCSSHIGKPVKKQVMLEAIRNAQSRIRIAAEELPGDSASQRPYH
jgi:PAS domain S-box-containing protein